MKDWARVQDLLSGSLSEFLSTALPEIGGDGWWNTYVLEQLSPGQARSLSSVKVGDLRSLDLAALIRVADRSWSEFVYKRSMNRDSRALLVELKVARNRYAHAPVNGVALDDQLRDVDTARRFMQSIGSNANALKEVTKIHRELLIKITSDEDDIPNQPPPDKPQNPNTSDPKSFPDGDQSKPNSPTATTRTNIDKTLKPLE